LGLQPTESGRMQVDTIGSSVDTLLAIYAGSDYRSLRQIGCNDNGAPDGIHSLIQFDAISGTPYTVVADAVNGAVGSIQINWRLGQGPTFSTVFSNIVARAGQP